MTARTSRKPARAARTAEPAAPAAVVPRARAALLAHFDAHRRDLPWRRTRDPYAIWVSEVMLQQTRVETVIPYYERFLARFPTARALADAPEEAVLAAWAGLGYYSRARRLQAGARRVVELHEGAVPANADALRALPGVGAYTAGAIASIAFGLREPVVDGNVERVLARVFALPGDPRAAETRKKLWELARSFADCDRPGAANEALMELGATVCTPVAPRCLLCPARSVCAARAEGDPERYPAKRAKPAPRAERWTALVAFSPARDAVWLAPVEAGRWQGMLLPPMARADDAGAARALAEGAEGARAVGVVEHALTHAVMSIDVLVGTLAPARAAPRGRMVPLAELGALAVPKVTRAILAAATKPVSARRTRAATKPRARRGR